MNAFIFAGPSIGKADLAALCDARILPPAAMGDIYRAARLRPRAIGIIDGYFEGAPSVWHKEILWAMAEGIEVFGAASMGALRAAELSAFGMRGIGGIFADYLSGRIEDDDEVAVEHGPAETGYITVSEPMVNMRATLDRAVAEAVVTEGLSRALTGLAKRQFYKERGWDNLLRLARDAGVAASELDALAQWLPRNKIDRKRDDALKLAAAMAEFLASAHGPAPRNFGLEWTVMWDKATRSFLAYDGIAPADEESIAALVLEELRLDPDRYLAVRRGAVARKLVDGAGPPDHAPIDAPSLREEITRFRTRNGLLTRNTLVQWLGDNGLDEAEFERLIEDELRLAKAGAGRGLDRHLLAELQLGGTYAALARRARDKREVLRKAAHASGRLHVMQARLWYFESCLGRPVPDDITRYAQDLGFADLEALDRALTREYAFRRSRRPDG